jgi:hypothetical protein
MMTRIAAMAEAYSQYSFLNNGTTLVSGVKVFGYYLQAHRNNYLA